MNTELRKIGRLAMREEGTLWCAYYAMPDTMDKAIFLGSIRVMLVKGHPERGTAFMDMMRDAVAELLKEQLGVMPEWPDGVQLAPEHERGGPGRRRQLGANLIRLVDTGEARHGSQKSAD
jgi:hypothetical protein